ncbi:MAG: hypothetical protein V3W44_10810 [Dehalococcoidales bacterium]
MSVSVVPCCDKQDLESREHADTSGTTLTVTCRNCNTVVTSRLEIQLTPFEHEVTG